MFRYGTATVHPHVFRSALGRYLEIHDYEVHQTDTGARITVEVDGTPDLEALGVDLRVALARAGLTDAEVQIDVTPELGRTQAGKRRAVAFRCAEQPHNAGRRAVGGLSTVRVNTVAHFC